jgi:uroporphyrinogen-III synthase
MAKVDKKITSQVTEKKSVVKKGVDKPTAKDAVAKKETKTAKIINSDSKIKAPAKKDEAKQGLKPDAKAIAKQKLEAKKGLPEDVKLPRSVKKILISQPEPTGERSPYHEISKRYGFRMDFVPYLNVEGIPLREYRKNKINIPDFSAVIFNSKNAIDFFFKVCDELRYKMPQEAKYFCSSEQIAFYLQKYIQYRKRKVVYANGTATDLQTILTKNKVEKFLLPCSAAGIGSLPIFLSEGKFDFAEAVMYRMVPNEALLKKNFEYDLITFFNPEGVRAFFSLFPEFKQGKTIIGAFGASTQKELEDNKMYVMVKAPIGEIKSMVMAIEKMFKDNPSLSVN